MNYNLLVLGGNITREVKLSYTPSQVEIADFGIAVNKKYITKSGEQRESVLYIDCVAFKNNAVNLNKYVSNGSPILLTGELQFDTWEKDGQRKSKHKMLVQSFQFLATKPKAEPKNEQPPSEEEP